MQLNFYNNEYIKTLCQRRPSATARIRGGSRYPLLRGRVNFVQANGGVLVISLIKGLPNGGERRVFGFHIHEGKSCAGTPEEPFAETMGHYNPDNLPHPYHSGDMPPLFGNDGTAFSVFLTNRFKIDEIIGRTVVIHAQPDDFTSQPSGNSGEKMACGIIEEIK